MMATNNVTNVLGEDSKKASSEALILTGVRQRLEKYQNECRKKPEYVKKERIEVGQLDDSQTDLSKFQHSPVKPSSRPKFVVDSGRLAKLEFENDQSESYTTIDSPLQQHRAIASKKQSKVIADEEENRAKVHLTELINGNFNHNPTDGNNNDNNGSTTNNSTNTDQVVDVTKVKKTPFKALRLRYMEAVSKLRPDPVDLTKIQESADQQASRVALKLKRQQDLERKKQFSSLVQGWDDYEKCAQDKPRVRSDQDKQDEVELAQIEDSVTTAWVDHVDQVVRVSTEYGHDDDDEDEDLSYWIAEAKRLRAEAEARKQARLYKEKVQQALEEEDYWIQEAIKLREADRASKKAQNGGAGGASRALRPGMMRGNSFGDDDGHDDHHHEQDQVEVNQNGNKANFRRVGPDGRIEDSSDDDDNDDNEGKSSPEGSNSDDRRWGGQDGSARAPRRGARRNPYDHVQRASSRVGPDGRIEDWSDDDESEQQEEEEEESAPPKSRRGVNSLRPGMMRGNSFDLDDPPPMRQASKEENNNDNDNESKNTTAAKNGNTNSRVSANGRPVMSDSDSDSEDSVPAAAAVETKKKVKKPVELIEDQPLECPTTPRNPDGTIWSNPLKAWMNKPKKIKEVGAQIMVKVPAKTDCWRKTRHNFIMDNAPFYWHKVTGNFQVIVKVSGTFFKMYDKAGLMIREDEETWILSGMEHFNDRMNHSTCVTRDYTDWSLAPLPENAEKAGIWFCLKRMGNAYESFYSIDGKVWIQTRQGLFSDKPVLKVGVVCACPMGDPYKAVFEYYRVQQI